MTMIIGEPFNPSEVALYGATPLTAAFGRSELEHAAAMIVRTCQVLGDKWQAVTSDDVNIVFKDDIDNGRSPFCLWMRNPFFKPDFYDLVERGYAHVENVQTRAVGLTEAGIERLRVWRYSGTSSL